MLFYGQLVLVFAINSDFSGVYCNKRDITEQEQSGVLSVSLCLFSLHNYIFLALFYGQFVLLCATNSDFLGVYCNKLDITKQE